MCNIHNLTFNLVPNKQWHSIYSNHRELFSKGVRYVEISYRWTQLIQNIRPSHYIAFFINAALHLTGVGITCMGSVSDCTKLFASLRKRQWFPEEGSVHWITCKSVILHNLYIIYILKPISLFEQSNTNYSAMLNHRNSVNIWIKNI